MTAPRLIGHAEALGWVRRAIASDRLAHAYLITGPRGVGRRTFAIEIAKTLNCLAPDPEARPDHTCQACRLIERNIHPDVRVVRRAPERRMIAMRASPASPQRDYADNVEFIQADAQLRPAIGRKKVYLILNAEELAPDAADRLLKTLEEPPSFVHFLLTAVERGAVQPTIVSRCQEIRLRPVPRAELAAALVSGGMDADQAEQLAALAGGRQGWAVAAARDPSVLERERAHGEELLAVLAGSRLQRLVRSRALADRWSAQPEAVRERLRSWLSWWRDVRLVQLGLVDRLAHLGSDQRAVLQSVAAQVPPEQAQAAEAQIQQTLADVDANVNVRLALDLLVLKLPRAQVA